mgnify:FL=1
MVDDGPYKLHPSVLGPLLAALARHTAYAPDEPEPADNAEPVTPAAGPHVPGASGEDQPQRTNRQEIKTMDKDTLRITRADTRWASRALLAHTLCCPFCTDCYASGGGIGNGCAGGRILRLSWAEHVEAVQYLSAHAVNGTQTNHGD